MHNHINGKNEILGNYKVIVGILTWTEQRWKTDFFPKKYSAEDVANIQNMDSDDVAFTIGLNIVGATNRISTSDNLPLLSTQNETKLYVPKSTRSDDNKENQVDPTTPNKQRNQDHGEHSYEEKVERLPLGNVNKRHRKSDPTKWTQNINKKKKSRGEKILKGEENA